MLSKRVLTSHGRCIFRPGERRFIPSWQAGKIAGRDADQAVCLDGRGVAQSIRTAEWIVNALSNRSAERFLSNGMIPHMDREFFGVLEGLAALDKAWANVIAAMLTAWDHPLADKCTRHFDSGR